MSNATDPFSASIIPFEVPEQMRAFAERGVSQARDNYAKFKDAAETHNGTIEAVFTSAGKGANAYSAKLLEFYPTPSLNPGLVSFNHTERWFDTDAFALQPFGTFGNVGRNTIITPGLMQWDFSVHKDFRIVENHSLQFRFEAFNFPNHPNWANPDTGTTSVNFGKIRGTRTNMRELQFALKYLF